MVTQPTHLALVLAALGTLATLAPASADECQCAAGLSDLKANWVETSLCAVESMEKTRHESMAVMSEGVMDAAARNDHVGKYWDLRTYIDPATGRKQYPWVFAKTFVRAWCPAGCARTRTGAQNDRVRAALSRLPGVF